MKVREIMKKPRDIGPNATVREAAEMMARCEIGSLIVTENGKVKGIVTDGDIVDRFVAVSKKTSQEVKVREIMTSPTIKVEPNENVEFACGMMVRNKIKHLAVIEKDKLVGVLTATDIMEHAPEIGVDSFF